MNLRLGKYYSDNLMPWARSKTPVLISQAHMDWVRRRVCVYRRSPGVDAHHVQFRSHGQNDYTAIPLSHDVHMDGHSRGFDKIEAACGIDLKDALIATLVERVYELECELKLRRPL